MIILLIGNYDTRTAYNETKSFLKQNKEVTAIFAISDIMAIGVAKGSSRLWTKSWKRYCYNRVRWYGYK